MIKPNGTQYRETSSRQLVRRNCAGNLSHMAESALPSHAITLRVRYPEVDAMGYLHHSRYLQYFEMGRVELLRSLGHSYAELEQQGVFFVVVKAEVRYKAPARYDEELTLTTRLVRATTVRYDHVYELRRGNLLLAEANTTIACVNRQGEVMQIPEFLNAPRAGEPGGAVTG